MRKNHREEKICLISKRPYLSFRSINVSPNLAHFFPPFSRDISLFEILFSSSLSFPILRFSILLYRDLGIRFSFLSQFPLVGGHFLLFTSLSAPLLAPFGLRFLFAAISVDAAALGYGILFSCNLLTTFQSRKVMCTGYPT